jgi:hypothetical protein
MIITLSLDSDRVYRARLVREVEKGKFDTLLESPYFSEIVTPDAALLLLLQVSSMNLNKLETEKENPEAE